MLTKTYPTLRPVPTYPPVVYGHPPQQQRHTFYPDPTRPNPADITWAAKFKITPEEYVRRDKIVRQMWAECPFHTNEVVSPKSQEGRDKWGTRLVVKQVFKSYFDFDEKDKWPNDDRPLIITAELQNGNLVICTPDFLMKGKTSVC
jgi:hypothetical protein